jgi:hypothetical protein
MRAVRVRSAVHRAHRIAHAAIHDSAWTGMYEPACMHAAAAAAAACMLDEPVCMNRHACMLLLLLLLLLRACVRARLLA